MAKRNAKPAPPADGFWDRPALMNLVADVLIFFSVAGLAWAAVTVFQRLPVFPLRQLVVTNDVRRVTHAQLDDAARSALAGNFFTVDLDGAREAFEKLPWVRRADVRRRWPDTIELAVEEHRAVARWRGVDGESRLVNEFGEVFQAAAPAELPLFAGPEGSAPRVLARHREFSEVLVAVGRRPRAVILSAREAWQLRLDDGVLVDLGRDQAKHPLGERLARFTTYYQAARAKAGVGALLVDMRYPNGFALRPGRGAADKG
ncbi:MAG TPA: cell division protein FtsQ/DivIB [Rhodocyclaceae bacterium]|nr:cell division protein FtsQ/DivIB [Rhodocyclaceae bacterium]HNH36119.1 cell division protein FtsQ/DivIB [Rhodocyclaceae bacterium]